MCQHKALFYGVRNADAAQWCAELRGCIAFSTFVRRRSSQRGRAARPCNGVACHCLSSRNFHKKLLPRLAEKIHVFTTEVGPGVSDLRCETQAPQGSAGSAGGWGWLRSLGLRTVISR